jgi:hypothetical protein
MNQDDYIIRIYGRDRQNPLIMLPRMQYQMSYEYKRNLNPLPICHFRCATMHTKYAVPFL